MKTKVILLIILISTLILIYFIGNFHFAKGYIIEREVNVNNIEEIECVFWKYDGGYIDSLNVDLIDFRQGGYFIRNDTLFLRKQPVARAERLIQRCFSDYLLTLTSFDGKKTQYFVSK